MIRERSCAVKEEKPCDSLEGLNGGSRCFANREESSKIMKKLGWAGPI